MEEVYEAFDKSERISVYTDGIKTQYSAGDEAYKTILAKWNASLAGSHQMPAFGVSLNRETLESMQSGKWVEFEFGEIYESNGLPFEKLLIEVDKGMYGFNLVRYTKEFGYDGRCIYIDLAGKNLDDFYEFLLNY